MKAATGTEITPNEAALWFVHTSVVRCCSNLEKGKQAPPEMYWSCRRYLEEEISIWKPDVVWTQGDEAYEAMSWLARFILGWPTSIIFPHQRQLDFPIATGS